MKWLMAICAIICSAVAYGELIPCERQNSEIIVCQNLTAATIVKINAPNQVNVTVFNAQGIAPDAFKDLQVREFIIAKKEKPWYSSSYTLYRRDPVDSLTLLPGSFNSLKNIAVLEIYDTKLPFGIFEHHNTNPLVPLTKLEQLVLGNNELLELPTNMLSPLVSLQYLRVSDNNISVIHANTFAVLKNLKTLDLTNNGIQTLEPGCFNGLNALISLNLLDNNIVSPNGRFNKEALRGMPNLVNLSISINDNVSLEPGTFDGSPKLENIDLRYSNIAHLPKNLFQNLPFLAELQFEHSTIGSIEPYAFSGLNLRSMRFDYAHIGATIESHTFSDFNSTQLLFIENPELREIQPRAFSGFNGDALAILDNKLTRLVAETFTGLHVDKFALRGTPYIVEVEHGAFKDAYIRIMYIDNNSTIVANKDKWGIPTDIVIETVCYGC